MEVLFCDSVFTYDSREPGAIDFAYFLLSRVPSIFIDSSSISLVTKVLLSFEIFSVIVMVNKLGFLHETLPSYIR